MSAKSSTSNPPKRADIVSDSKKRNSRRHTFPGRRAATVIGADLSKSCDSSSAHGLSIDSVPSTSGNNQLRSSNTPKLLTQIIRSIPRRKKCTSEIDIFSATVNEARNTLEASKESTEQPNSKDSKLDLTTLDCI